MRRVITWYVRLDPWTRSDLHKVTRYTLGIVICFYLLWRLP